MIRITYFITLFIFTISCKTSTYWTDINIENQRLDIYQTEEEQIKDIIEPYKIAIDKEMNEVIGTLEMELSKQRPESTLGNWLSDMLQDELETTHNLDIDFSLQNHGGVRVNSVAAGAITVGKIYEIMPFDNSIVVMSADGELVKVLFDHIAADGGWPVSRNIEFQIQNDKATSIMINDEPLDLNKEYTFALSDYVANGGSGCSFLKELERENLGLYLRDVFLNHIRRETDEGKSQNSHLDQRIKLTDHE